MSSPSPRQDHVTGSVLPLGSEPASSDINQPAPAGRSTRSHEPFALMSSEERWRDRYNWLLEQGYRLRPRYHPEWEPSWKKDPTARAGLTEDSRPIANENVIDAIRVEDDKYVVLKLVEKQAADVDEALILQYFSEEPRRSDPRNHCIELLDVLEIPDDGDHAIVVLPVLRPYDSPDFDTVGEGLDFLRQVMQGLAFLHEHRVAHRDIRSDNFLMDGQKMYIDQFRVFDPDKKLDYSGPARLKRTRSACWPKYYIIDFGFSKRYREQDMPPFEYLKRATDGTVPEFDNPGGRYNPFPIDVYSFGNLIRMDFIEGNPDSILQNGRQGFEFLRPLVESMTQRDPDKRPTMQEALDQLEDIISKQGSWKLRSRPVRITGGLILRPNSLDHLQTTAGHWARKLRYLVTFQQPLPPRPANITTDPSSVEDYTKVQHIHRKGSGTRVATEREASTPNA